MLKANLKKTKVMVSGSKGEVLQSKVDPWMFRYFITIHLITQHLITMGLSTRHLITFEFT